MPQKRRIAAESHCSVSCDQSKQGIRNAPFLTQPGFRPMRAQVLSAKSKAPSERLARAHSWDSEGF